MGIAISIILNIFIETFIKAFLSCSIFIAREILDESITVFTSNGNIIESALNILSLNGTNIAKFFIGIGKGTTLVLFLIQIIDSLIKSATGEECEHPLKITGRCIATYLLIIAMFGTQVLELENFDLQSGLLQRIGHWGAELISYIEIPYDSLKAGTEIESALSWLTDLPSKIGAIILYAALLGSTLGASISYVERFASLGLTVLMGPMCLSLYATKEGQDSAKQWFTSIIIQFFCIFLSLALWAFFISRIKLTEQSTVFELVVLVIALNLMKDSEQIFKALGFQTMPNIDSAKAMMGGVAIASDIASHMQSIGDGIERNHNNRLARKRMKDEEKRRKAEEKRRKFEKQPITISVIQNNRVTSSVVHNNRVTSNTYFGKRK